MNSIIKLIEFGLDGSYARHKALSNNIANVSTPNYKRKDVNFLQVLNRNIDYIKDEKKPENKNTIRTASTHFKNSYLTGNNVNKNINFKVDNYSNTSFRNDKNNVDIDVEMAKLAKNNLYYNTLAQQISGKFSLLQEVIQKGSE